MACEQDGLALGFQLQQKPTNILHAGFIQSVHRLVQDQNIRVFHDRLCNAETLPHAERIFAHMLAAFGVKPHAAHRFRRLLFRDRPAQRRKIAQILYSALCADKAGIFNDDTDILCFCGAYRFAVY